MAKSLKRIIGEYKVKQRKREEERIRNLTAKRNKAVRDAAVAARKAQLLEDKKDAELKKSKALKKTPRSGEDAIGRFASSVRSFLKDVKRDERPKRKRRVVKAKRKTTTTKKRVVRRRQPATRTRVVYQSPYPGYGAYPQYYGGYPPPTMQTVMETAPARRKKRKTTKKRVTAKRKPVSRRKVTRRRSEYFDENW